MEKKNFIDIAREEGYTTLQNNTESIPGGITYLNISQKTRILIKELLKKIQNVYNSVSKKR